MIVLACMYIRENCGRENVCAWRSQLVASSSRTRPSTMATCEHSDAHMLTSRTRAHRYAIGARPVHTHACTRRDRETRNTFTRLHSNTKTHTHTHTCCEAHAPLANCCERHTAQYSSNASRCSTTELGLTSRRVCLCCVAICSPVLARRLGDFAHARVHSQFANRIPKPVRTRALAL